MKYINNELCSKYDTFLFRFIILLFVCWWFGLDSLGWLLLYDSTGDRIAKNLTFSEFLDDNFE